jgi:hypothetical protein
VETKLLASSVEEKIRKDETEGHLKAECFEENHLENGFAK